MNTEQITALVAAVVALLQVVTIAVGIWNKNRTDAIAADQKKIVAHLTGVEPNGKALDQMLDEQKSPSDGAAQRDQG